MKLCRSGGIGRHAGLSSKWGKNKLSALSEKREVEFRKFGEGLTANTEPILDVQEGVETRHGIPKSKDMVKV